MSDHFFQAPTKGRDPNPSGLGRAIINRKVKDARRAEESGLVSALSPFKYNLM